MMLQGLKRTSELLTALDKAQNPMTNADRAGMAPATCKGGCMSKPRFLGAVKTAPTKTDKFALRYRRNQQRKAMSKRKGGYANELEK